ncbi:EAL domain-containing protein [Sinorhizobium sp. BG8]|uniref:sensor domain-containing protein n=1 Tax=Sinorhizobium sp. BG8 TaxID=2613773 RepID=UPI001AF5C297|nr:EAL domain-containing protein [Sinorhizobium sp. BG8]QRM55632.1 EAL domain-containing protein [Sinorhizobium sp. BG8]
MVNSYATHSTQRTRAGQAALFLQCFEHSAFGMAIIDREARILGANCELRRLFGQEDTSFSRSLLESIATKDRPVAVLAVANALETRPVSTPCEIRLISSEGVERWVLLSFTRMVSPDGDDDLLVAQCAEIDAYRRRELELSEREARWNDALESAGQGVWDHDFSRNRLFYSRQWRAMRGIGPDEEIDGSLDNWINTVHPEDRERVVAEIRKQERAETAFNVFSYRERHRDGRWIWIECRGAVVEYDEKGVPSRIAGTDTDITERKEAEEFLAHVSRRLELALEISRIGVFEANLTTGLLTWDDRLLQMYGKQGDVASALDWHRSLHPADRQRAIAVVEDAVAKWEAYSNEFRIVRGDGEVRYIRSRGAPFVDPNGVPKLIGANWDVTDDVRLQEELQRAKTLAEARNEELELARVRIEYTALHDHLTGLPNRRFLDARIDECAKRAATSGARIAILHIDLDRFKEINDTLGHQAGDRMLMHAAEVLKEHAGPGDFVARVGGDEFIFLSSDTAGRNLATLADGIVAAMRQPVIFDGHVCRFGASIGIASGIGPAIDARQLLINADLALYRAKNKGRSRHEFFTAEIQTQIIVNKQTADEILSGIEQNRFLPFYQPQFCAKTLDIVGVETLARWDHPLRGILSPDSFLKIAEDINVVATIDRIVLEASLADFSRWSHAGIGIPRLSVNVSSRRLHDPDLGLTLRGLAIQPSTVSFELLESIFLDDCDRVVVENLAEIRRQGIDIEIDDFGTGHASIVSLLKLKPRRLKIDRQLIRPISRSAEQRRLVATIIEIGRSLGIEVIGEGIETTAHAQILRDLGCDILQGYGLARPMPASAVEPFVAAQEWRRNMASAHELQEDLRRSMRR